MSILWSRSNRKVLFILWERTTKKEPNVHIEHNETIINNFDASKELNGDSIYQEEKLRAEAREKIAREEKRKADLEAGSRRNMHFWMWIFIILIIIVGFFI